MFHLFFTFGIPHPEYKTILVIQFISSKVLMINLKIEELMLLLEAMPCDKKGHKNWRNLDHQTPSAHRVENQSDFAGDNNTMRI